MNGTGTTNNIRNLLNETIITDGEAVMTGNRLTIDSIFANTVDASTITGDVIKTNSLTLSSLSATNGTFQSISTTTLSVGTLTGLNLLQISSLSANTITATTVNTTFLSAMSLITPTANISSLIGTNVNVTGFVIATSRMNTTTMFCSTLSCLSLSTGTARIGNTITTTLSCTSGAFQLINVSTTNCSTLNCSTLNCSTISATNMSLRTLSFQSGYCMNLDVNNGINTGYINSGTIVTSDLNVRDDGRVRAGIISATRGDFEILDSHYFAVDEMSAVSATIDSLTCNSISTGSIVTNTAIVSLLKCSDADVLRANIETLSCASAAVGTVYISSNAYITNISIENPIEKLSLTNVYITQENVQKGQTQYSVEKTAAFQKMLCWRGKAIKLTVEALSVKKGFVNDLQANTLKVNGTAFANYFTIENSSVTTENVETGNILQANIATANVENLVPMNTLYPEQANIVMPKSVIQTVPGCYIKKWFHIENSTTTTRQVMHTLRFPWDSVWAHSAGVMMHAFIRGNAPNQGVRCYTIYGAFRRSTGNNTVARLEWSGSGNSGATNAIINSSSVVGGASDPWNYITLFVETNGSDQNKVVVELTLYEDDPW
jgi:trimeric autotransporter adhesin